MNSEGYRINSGLINACFLCKSVINRRKCHTFKVPDPCPTATALESGAVSTTAPRVCPSTGVSSQVEDLPKLPISCGFVRTDLRPR